MKNLFNSKNAALLGAVRLIIIVAVSLAVASIVCRYTYKDYYDKRLFKLHTADLSTLANQMTVKLNFLLSREDRAGVQNVLDASSGLFNFIITDCSIENRLCPEQKILFTSAGSTPWARSLKSADLASGSFAVLRRLHGVSYLNNSVYAGSGMPGEIIGRLYVVNNMPHSFTDDYLAFVKAPFADVSARRFYLQTNLSFIAGSFIIWTFAELYFMVRRKQQFVLERREFELKQSVNRQMKELAEKDALITRLNEQSNRQYEEYVEKIRSLNYKVQNEGEYRDFAEQIIADLERDKSLEAVKYADELSTVRMDMERLQEKVREFEKTSKKRKESSFQVLEEAIRTPQFSNVFEQRVFEVLSATEQYKNGSWRMLSNFDVAPGRNYRQFTDFILFNKDALIILEAKYYVGLIDSPGDFNNDIWISTGTQIKKIDCLWGENPYHQLNEYSMSLMKLLKQKSLWNFQIFGIIIFPDEADISKIGEHLGKFYRITTISKLAALCESIFVEAGRFQAAKHPKRPSALQVEEMLRGRKNSH